MSRPRIGIIGGSGLYAMEEGFQLIEELDVETPFGAPSDAFVLGTIDGREALFLARHGRGHRISPSEINFRANLWGMKKLGADAIIAVSAVGSLREAIKPGHLVVPDQFIDRTRGRLSTFFTDGIVAHVGFAEPFCEELRRIVLQAARQAGATVHDGGTYVCMEGPQFSTKAESNLYRSWGGDVIGMTNLQEAKLAREAELAYATLALSTDYDCWHPGHAAVTIEQIIAVLQANVAMAKRIIRGAVALVPESRDWKCHHALQHAILTRPEAVPSAVKERLGIIVGKYL